MRGIRTLLWLVHPARLIGELKCFLGLGWGDTDEPNCVSLQTTSAVCKFEHQR